MSVGTGAGIGTVEKIVGARNRNLGKMARFRTTSCHSGLHFVNPHNLDMDLDLIGWGRGG
jgi:hypothetical protein